jgi:solute carrier family 35 protein F1/2
MRTSSSPAATTSSSPSCGNEYPNALRGDIYVLIAAALYAISNVAQEKLVKHYDRIEFLGALGTFGTVICVAILLLLERDEISIFLQRMDYIATLELFGFVACLLIMYCVTSKFLQEGDALMFNLSTLTSDVYGALFSVLLFHSTPHWLYGVAFVCVAFGIVVYGNGGKVQVEERGRSSSDGAIVFAPAPAAAL